MDNQPPTTHVVTAGKCVELPSRLQPAGQARPCSTQQSLTRAAFGMLQLHGASSLTALRTAVLPVIRPNPVVSQLQASSVHAAFLQHSGQAMPRITSTLNEQPQYSAWQRTEQQLSAPAHFTMTEEGCGATIPTWKMAPLDTIMPQCKVPFTCTQCSQWLLCEAAVKSVSYSISRLCYERSCLP